MPRKPEPPQKRTRAEASRHNGAKSSGPKTPEGKSKSSQNAVKHGFGARSLVLASESPILFAEYKEHYWKHFRPRNLVEADLVIEMVGARWRLRRIWSHETALLDTEIDKRLPPDPDPDDPNIDILIEQALAFKTLADESNSLEMLHRYETRYRRCYDRALRNLQQLRENDPLDPKAPIFDSIPGPPLQEPAPPKAPEPAPQPQSPILQNEPERASNLNPPPHLSLLRSPESCGPLHSIRLSLCTSRTFEPGRAARGSGTNGHSRRWRAVYPPGCAAPPGPIRFISRTATAPRSSMLTEIATSTTALHGDRLSSAMRIRKFALPSTLSSTADSPSERSTTWSSKWPKNSSPPSRARTTVSAGIKQGHSCRSEQGRRPWNFVGRHGQRGTPRRMSEGQACGSPPRFSA